MNAAPSASSRCPHGRGERRNSTARKLDVFKGRRAALPFLAHDVGPLTREQEQCYALRACDGPPILNGYWRFGDRERRCMPHWPLAKPVPPSRVSYSCSAIWITRRIKRKCQARQWIAPRLPLRDLRLLLFKPDALTGELLNIGKEWVDGIGQNFDHKPTKVTKAPVGRQTIWVLRPWFRNTPAVTQTIPTRRVRNAEDRGTEPPPTSTSNATESNHPVASRLTAGRCSGRMRPSSTVVVYRTAVRRLASVHRGRGRHATLRAALRAERGLGTGSCARGFRRSGS
jgi:hypothetical protein